jgi:membrane dipeptidase
MTATRRSFLKAGIATAAAAATLETHTIGQAPEPPDFSGFSIDTLVNDGPGFNVQQAIDAGLTACVVDLAIYPRNYSNALRAVAEWDIAFKREKRFVKATCFSELQRAKKERKFGVVLACQDASILDTSTLSVNGQNIDNLEFFYDLGLRVLQMTHNEANPLGDSFREKRNAGLSWLGEKVVAAMNSLGMLVDLSHCGKKTTLEAIALSKQPCAITHTGCQALCPTARNKSDEEIRALADKGGVIGVFNMSQWLTQAPKTSIDDVIGHIDHIVNIAGIDHVSFGSDGPVLKSDVPESIELRGLQSYVERNAGMPGAEWMPKHAHVEELNSPNRLLRLAEALSKRGYKAESVEKIVGGNFVRLFHDVCG